ncbi:MAG: histidine ammonia-lyase [Deltaproteobacteria bacterium]|nr:histidine ammonia-lyase [Deltaproteobacteria bacterium]
MERVLIDGKSLSLKDFMDVSRDGARVEISAEAMERVIRSRDIVEGHLEAGLPMYGINTGFGKFENVSIPEDQLKALQINLIRADAVGIGDALSKNIVRGVMLLRVNSLARGYSGARPEVLTTLLEMLNRGVTPVIPEKGSVGASGDLCPLAHMVLPMIGEGEAEFGGDVLEGAEAMDRAGLPLLKLLAKEGLALINGTPVMTSVAAFALDGAANLARCADIIGAMSVEALRGIIDPFDPRIHQIRGQNGQIASARNLRRLLHGSARVSRQGEFRMQDAYSLRCMPQIHGACRMAIDYAASVVNAELNAVTDNPLVFENGDVLSGGNFHGEPIAIAMDALGIAVSELGNLSERRMAKLVDPAHNHGLPAFLVTQGGINCGFMVPQYASAALVSENKILAHPASVDSIPTSAGQEDHVSMGTIAARKALQIVEHAQAILGIEWMAAAQGLDLQPGSGLGEGTAPAYGLLRETVSYMKEDRVFYKDQAAAARLIASGALSDAVEKAVGQLD